MRQRNRVWIPTKLSPRATRKTTIDMTTDHHVRTLECPNKGAVRNRYERSPKLATGILLTWYESLQNFADVYDQTGMKSEKIKKVVLGLY